MSDDNEIWKDIEGYDGYQVSNKGNVRSISRIISITRNGRKHLRIQKGQVLKALLDKDGYLRIWLYKDKRRKFIPIHRLVAEAFIPNPENLPHVNHKSEVKTENFVENLEWCDAKYNSNYGTRTLRIAQQSRKHILQLSTRGEPFICWFSLTDASNETNIPISGISHCANGKRKTCGGYKWAYI